MKLHPVLGAELLENVPIEVPEVISLFRYQHERFPCQKLQNAFHDINPACILIASDERIINTDTPLQQEKVGSIFDDRADGEK